MFIKTQQYALIATVLGLLATGVALYLFFFGPLGEENPVLSEPLTIVVQGTLVLGFIAAAMGVLGLAAGGDNRANFVAVTMGMTAILFHFSVTMMLIFIAVVVLAALVTVMAG